MSVSDLTDGKIVERDTTRYRWYVLILLLLLYVMSAADRSVISIVVEPMKAEFDLSDKQIGLLPMAFSLVFGLMVLPMGWLVDRVDRRALLSISAAIWSLMTATCAIVPNFAAMFIARMGVGAGEASAGPASLSIIADTFPPRKRNTAVGIYVCGVHIGNLLIFLGGGWLLLHLDWRSVFLIAGGPGLLLAGLLYFSTREPKRGAFDGAGSGTSTDGDRATTLSIRATVSNILRNPALCYAIPAMTIAAGAAYSMTVWTISFLVRLHGLSISQAAMWSGIGFGLLSAIGSFVVGPIADRFSRGNLGKLALIPLISTFFAIVGGAILVLADSLWVSLAGLIILSLMIGFFMPTGYSLQLSLSAPEYRGTAIATNKLASQLIGTGPIPFLTGLVSDSVGGSESLRPALLCTIALMLVSIGLCLMVYRHAGRCEKI